MYRAADTGYAQQSKSTNENYTRISARAREICYREILDSFDVGFSRPCFPPFEDLALDERRATKQKMISMFSSTWAPNRSPRRLSRDIFPSLISAPRLERSVAHAHVSYLSRESCEHSPGVVSSITVARSSWARRFRFHQAACLSTRPRRDRKSVV